MRSSYRNTRVVNRMASECETQYGRLFTLEEALEGMNRCARMCVVDMRETPARVISRGNVVIHDVTHEPPDVMCGFQLCPEFYDPVLCLVSFEPDGHAARFALLPLYKNGIETYFTGPSGAGCHVAYITHSTRDGAPSPAPVACIRKDSTS